MDTRQILEEFPAYLEANRLARPQHIPFPRRWAERYVSAPADPALSPDDRLRTFLAALEQTPGVADWQVRQAGDAVVLLRQFAATRRPQASRAGATPPSAAGDAAVPLLGAPVVVGEAWTKTLSAARDLLRLRRYSPKTETAYLDWSRRFAAYCGNRPPFTLAEGDLKRYLTHLAMERHVSASTQNLRMSRMPRRATRRLLLPGLPCCYHITQRCQERRFLLRHAKDRRHARVARQQSGPRGTAGDGAAVALSARYEAMEIHLTRC